jgi:hypothetical protein
VGKPPSAAKAGVFQAPALALIFKIRASLTEGGARVVFHSDVPVDWPGRL